MKIDTNMTIVQLYVRRALVVALIGLPLAACKSDRVVTGSVPTAVEDRYPIGVVPERTKLDLNADGYGLSAPDAAVTREFVLDWRERGTGGLEVFTPIGTRNEAEAASVVEDVKEIAYAYGMPVDAVHVRQYHTTLSVAPVRLAYERMMATLECGAWPTNVAQNWQNLPYENFGCAYQKNMAAMVENPRDLEGPRPQTPRDAQRRDTVFGKYRAGEDPSTIYNNENKGEVAEVEN